MRNDGVVFCEVMHDIQGYCPAYRGWVHSMQGMGAQYAPKEKELNNNKLNNTKTMESGSRDPFL